MLTFPMMETIAFTTLTHLVHKCGVQHILMSVVFDGMQYHYIWNNEYHKVESRMQWKLIQSAHISNDANYCQTIAFIILRSCAIAATLHRSSVLVTARRDTPSSLCRQEITQKIKKAIPESGAQIGIMVPPVKRSTHVSAEHG